MVAGLIGLIVSGAAAPAETSQRTLTHADIEARYADAESKFAVIDGVRLHYKDSGSGPAVLLIHGSLGDLGDWDGWLPVLTPHYRVVRFDLPGFGLSGEIENGNYSIDRSLALIDGLMDSLGIERFAVVGVSYGGPIAFRYAATRTERVDALVIMNSAGIENGRQQVDPKTGAKDFYRSVTSTAPFTRDAMQHMLEKGFHDPAHLSAARVLAKLDYMNVVDRDREGATMIAQYVRGDPERVLAHVRAPTLVLWGAAERSLSLATADRFVAALRAARDVRKLLIEDGDHAMHIEFPAASAGAVRAFLDDHPRLDSALPH